MSEENIKTSDLVKKSCKPCEGGDVAALSESEIQNYLKSLKGWDYKKGVIQKAFSFKNYYETVSFINAIAWVANKENHHPDITFGYKDCQVCFKTHAVNGITENDFISAAKIDELI